MPQATNRRSLDQPYGKGSLYADLQQVSNRTRERVNRLNKGEKQSQVVYTKLLEKDVLEASDRTCRDMDKVKHDLHKKAAYQQVLREFKVNDFKTLQKGFHPRHIQTPATYHRYTREYKIFNSGFSMSTLSQEVSNTLYEQSPERRRAKMIATLLEKSRTESSFLVNRNQTKPPRRTSFRKGQEPD